MAQRITKDGDMWTVGAMKFESLQAAELFLGSRTAARAGSAWATFGALPWYAKAALALVVLAIIGTAANIMAPSPAPDSARPSRAQALMAKSDSVAALINLNGQLCARVIEIEHIYLDQYKITCTRYRDGVGTSTYDIDLKTGQAR